MHDCQNISIEKSNLRLYIFDNKIGLNQVSDLNIFLILID